MPDHPIGGRVITVVSRCTSKHGGPGIDYEACGGWLDSGGTYHNHCGDACAFIMQKEGAGNPPFHYKRCLFAGETQVGKWEDAP